MSYLNALVAFLIGLLSNMIVLLLFPECRMVIMNGYRNAKADGNVVQYFSMVFIVLTGLTIIGIYLILIAPLMSFFLYLGWNIFLTTFYQNRIKE